MIEGGRAGALVGVDEDEFPLARPGVDAVPEAVAFEPVRVDLVAKDLAARQLGKFLRAVVVGARALGEGGLNRCKKKGDRGEPMGHSASSVGRYG